MKYVSTRGGVQSVTLREALEAGLAADGGLFVPERFPHFSISDFDGLTSLADIGARLLNPFFADDSVLKNTEVFFMG